MKLSQTMILPVVAGLLAGLPSCGGGGGGGAPPAEPFGNLQAAGVRVNTATPAAAHEMEMETTIVVSDPIDAVPVSYFLMNKADVDAEADDVRQYFVSSSVLENVEAGQHDLNAIVQVPKDVAGGEYYLIAQVDPEDAILETDEEDNIPPKTVVRIDDTKVGLSDIVVEEVEVDTEALILYPSDLYGNIGALEDQVNHDFGATVVLTTTGANEATNLDLSATITFPTNQRNPFPVRFWNSETGEYSDRIMTSVTPGIPTTEHLEIYIPVNNQARRMIDEYLRRGGTEKFRLDFRANELGNVAEWEPGSMRWDRDDNEVELDMVIVRPPEPPLDRIAWGRGYDKKWKNDTFTVGLGLRADASLDQRGAIASGEAGVPIKLFGKEFKMISFDSYARVTPRHNQPTDSEFSLDLKVFGLTVFTRGTTNPSYTWSRDWNITKTKKQSKLVFVGPVPVVAGAGATGVIGFRAEAFLDPAFMRMEVGPYVDADAFAEAAVEALVAKVGVRGSLTLIEDTFTASAMADLSLPSPTQLQGQLTFDITNKLQGPKGRLWLFAERRIPKFCYLVVPCGVNIVTDEKTLASFNSFSRTDVLFHNVKTAVVDL